MSVSDGKDSKSNIEEESKMKKTKRVFRAYPGDFSFGLNNK
jgi:hypothetical protein